MNEGQRRFSVTLFVLYWVLATVLTSLHELGHAALPLARGISVRTDLGATNGLEIRLGKWVLALGSLTNPWFGSTHYSKLAAADELVVLMAGPLVSLVCASVGLLVFQKIKNTPHRKARALALFTFWYAFIQALFTLVPLTYPDWLGGFGSKPSDGMRILELLQNPPPG